MTLKNIHKSAKINNKSIDPISNSDEACGIEGPLIKNVDYERVKADKGYATIQTVNFFGLNFFCY